MSNMRHNMFKDSINEFIKSILCDGSIYSRSSTNVTVFLYDPIIYACFVFNYQQELIKLGGSDCLYE